MSEQLIVTPGVFGDNGNFLLERELGSGGMGGVYMGRDKMLDRPVAVKVMLKELGSDPEFVEKFKKEAQAAARLIHPNIVQVYSYGICDGMPYMALELASGGSLFSLMSANPGKTDIQRVLKICQQTAQALQCATDQGFVHGDVKPENILLDANGNAKLVDFGLAAMQKDTDEIWGTPYYISPEKVKKEPVDFRADMYSLGGTLYHALTGVAPFEGEDSIAVVKKRFEGAPKKPSEIRPEITPAIDALVMKMLSLNKEDRYPSFEALLEAFKETLTSGLTQKISKPEESAKPKTATTATAAGKRMMVRGRRTTIMKKPTVSAVKPGTSSEASGKGSSSSEEDDEEEGGNLGAKVVMFVVGGLLAIGAVVGGLFWYISATKSAELAAQQAQIVSGCTRARQAVADHRAHAEKFDAEFKDFAEKATTECEKYTAELAKLLPDFASELKPAPTKELLDAQQLLLGPKPAEPAAPAATNAPAATVATTNAPAATPAPAPVSAQPAAEPQSEQPKKETPTAVNDIHELWERAYSCQASQIKISLMAKKVIAECDKAAALTDDTKATADALAALTQSAKELYDQMTGSKDVENVRKGISFIKSKGDKTIKQTVRRLTLEKIDNDRKIQKAKADEEEARRKAEQEAAKKALIEKETTEIAAKFNTIAANGSFRQLDWTSATRQLTQAGEDYKSAEGKLAVEFQLKKVAQMKRVQDIFIEKLKGYTFRGKLKGAVVTSVDANNIVLSREKKTLKISWMKFYKDYPGNFNEIINQFIVKGRHTAGLRPIDWKDAMTGAALTMRLVCFDIQGATEKAEYLAKEVVKQFPDYAGMMKKVFPDINFEGLEEE